MAAAPGVWGIDIGQCALKAVRLELIAGQVTATAFEYIEHARILSQPDADPDQLTREALDKFLERNPVRGDKVAMSVPGQSALARFVKLPPVEEKKIADIVAFEARQQIPYALEEVVWDFQKIGQGEVTDGFAIDTEIGLFAMKRDMVNRFMGHFTSAGMEVHIIQMAPLALTNYVSYDFLWQGGADAKPADEVPNLDEAPNNKKRCVVALDIGTDASNLIITDGARIIWQRPIPLGGSQFTRALTKELKLTFAKAEHLKRNAARSAELPQILKALKPVLTDFVGEVQRSLGYFTNTHRDAHIACMIGIGSAFKLPGLQKYLGDKLQLEIRKPVEFTRLVGDNVVRAPVFTENLLAYPVAYGLALQGLGLSRLTTSLLPPEITFERKIRAKKPYAVAAAAMLLMGTSIVALGYSMPYGAANDELLKKQMETSKTVVARVGTVNTAVKTSIDQVEMAKTEVAAIQAGTEERVNWVDAYRTIDLALPMPGPNGNMKADGQIQLWKTVEGNLALKRFEEQIANGVDPKKTVVNDNRSALPMVDVYAIHSRYVPDLKAFYDKVGTESKAELLTDWCGDVVDGGLPIPERTKLPEGAGWVFEIRGSTWYTGETTGVAPNRFIARTLVENLRNIPRMPALPKNAAPAPAATVPALAPAATAAPAAASLVDGQVSHVFLWGTFPDKEPAARTYRRVPNSFIDYIAAASQTASATGTTGTTPGMPGMPDPSSLGGLGGGGAAAPLWVPLTSGASAGGAGGPSMLGGPGLMRGAPSMAGSPSAAGGSGGPMLGGGGAGAGGGTSSNPWSLRNSVGGTGGGLGSPPVGPLGGPLGGPTDPAVVGKSKIRPRNEFVVVFVWKEPTPSDRLISTEAKK